MEIALNFIIKHKRIFFALFALIVIYQVWAFYRALRIAKAAAQGVGQGVGEGIKGTATSVASILTAPAKAIAAAVTQVVDAVVGTGTNEPVKIEGPIFTPPPQSDFETSLWGGQASPVSGDPTLADNPMFKP